MRFKGLLCAAPILGRCMFFFYYCVGKRSPQPPHKLLLTDSHEKILSNNLELVPFILLARKKLVYVKMDARWCSLFRWWCGGVGGGPSRVPYVSPSSADPTTSSTTTTYKYCLCEIVFVKWFFVYVRERFSSLLLLLLLADVPVTCGPVVYCGVICLMCSYACALTVWVCVCVNFAFTTTILCPLLIKTKKKSIFFHLIFDSGAAREWSFLQRLSLGLNWGGDGDTKRWDRLFLTLFFFNSANCARRHTTLRWWWWWCWWFTMRPIMAIWRRGQQ